MTHRELEGWGRWWEAAPSVWRAAAADCKAEGTEGGQATSARK